jgi:hypothetical protein
MSRILLSKIKNNHLHDFGWAEGVKKVIKEDIKPMVESHGNLPNLWWGKL